MVDSPSFLFFFSFLATSPRPAFFFFFLTDRPHGLLPDGPQGTQLAFPPLPVIRNLFDTPPPTPFSWSVPLCRQHVVTASPSGLPCATNGFFRHRHAPLRAAGNRYDCLWVKLFPTVFVRWLSLVFFFFFLFRSRHRLPRQRNPFFGSVQGFFFSESEWEAGSR